MHPIGPTVSCMIKRDCIVNYEKINEETSYQLYGEQTELVKSSLESNSSAKTIK